MKQIILSLLTIISLNVFAQDAVIKDDNAEKRTLQGSFTAIKVSNGIDLYLTQGDEESLAVSASDPKYMEGFKTVVEGNTLKIYYDSNKFNWMNTGKRKLKAYVSFKTLERLDGSSGAEVHVSGAIKSGSLKMDFSSGANFNGQVDVAALDVEQSSGAEVTATGKSDKLVVSVNSGAMFKGFDLQTEYCDAKASSGAGVRINVNKEINAKANSGGGIQFKGAGGIKDLSVHSGGSVKRV
ncbi:MAG: head GIN domain-containing protein [Ferruginibacter sp.]